jgi:hypothetical protein
MGIYCSLWGPASHFDLSLEGKFRWSLAYLTTRTPSSSPGVPLRYRRPERNDDAAPNFLDSHLPATQLPSAMSSRRFPMPWTAKSMAVMECTGIVLAHVYGQPEGAIAISGTRLAN